MNAPATTPTESLRTAMAALPLRTVVQEVVQFMMANQAFGSPLSVLEAEYQRQLTETMNLTSALYTRKHNAGDSHAADGSSPSRVDASTTGPGARGLTRDDLQDQYLVLHTLYTKQTMEMVARDERIARLCEKVTELTQHNHQLKKTIIRNTSSVDAVQTPVAAHASARAPVERRPSEQHDPDNTTAKLYVPPAGATPAEVIEGLQQLNLVLSQRIDVLEHNSSIGWVFVEPELERKRIELEQEIDRLAGLNAELATAYLLINENQSAASKRADAAEAELAIVARRRDQVEREIVALRIALERSKAENM